MAVNLSFSEEDFLKQEKSAKRKDMAGAFASWLNSMSINPDPNLPQVVQAAQARRADELKNNRTVNMLEEAGRDDIAKLVKTGVITGKEGAAQLFAEANAVRAQQRAMELAKFEAGLRTAKVPTSIQEYLFAQKDPTYAKFLADQDAEAPETPAGLKKLDEKFAETLSGTSAQMLAAARQDAAAVSSVLKRLESGEELTGPFIGSLPESLRAIVKPTSVQAQQLVEQVVQKNLRAILGGQFAQKEGEQLVRRAYNPLLPEEQNAARLRALLLTLDAAAENKMRMEKYFYENNYSLKGFKGPTGVPSISDFEAAVEAAVPSPEGSVTQAPKVGDVESFNGKKYKFLGGDPSDENSWEEI
jgi:hypothetical protein